jgi:cytochrome c oxidase subunit 3
MAQAQAAHGSDKYYIPHGSKWPAVGAVTLFVTMFGTSAVLNGWDIGPWIAWLGLAGVAYMFFGWFGTVIDESQRGLYNAGVDRSFRMGMTWFIFSEVMFFAAFFGALYYARQLSVPWLGGEGSRLTTNVFLWPDFEAAWPSNGPAGIGGEFQTIPAFGLPAINTAILLTSGVTITIAHHALRAGNRGMLKLFLALTFILGFVFVVIAAGIVTSAWPSACPPGGRTYWPCSKRRPRIVTCSTSLPAAASPSIRRKSSRTGATTSAFAMSSPGRGM